MATVTITTELEPITCCNIDCGITFAVPAFWRQRQRETHATWYCPNGHGQSYRMQTEAEQLRAELARERARRDQIEAEAREANRRLERLTKKGVCPYCKRNFSSVARHIKCKHPEAKR